MVVRARMDEPLRDAVTSGEFDDVLGQLPEDGKRLGTPRTS
jgi:hypothetical protein